MRPGLDTDRLADWLGWPHLSMTPLPGGKSRLTYLLTNISTMESCVLKRPPPGANNPSAHDVAREHRVTCALLDTPVPVPRPILLCADTEVIGAPFALSQFVDGTTYEGAAQLAEVGADGVRAIVDDLIGTLAVLHAIDPDSVGLNDFGRPDGFLARQLKRWKSAMDGHSGQLPARIGTLAEDLALTMPASGSATIVHGDYRLGNVLVCDNKVVAVLDWEMATIGDPLTDLGLLLCHASRTDDLLPNPATAPGHPAPGEMADRYARCTGRDVSGIGWYTAFAFFKLAVVSLGVAARQRAGHTAEAESDTFADLAVSATVQGFAALKEM
jgi:aminoglycoside phosphotransferase (APT) family kinase protein